MGPLLQIAELCQLLPREQRDEATGAHGGLDAGAKDCVEQGGEKAAVRTSDESHLLFFWNAGGDVGLVFMLIAAFGKGCWWLWKVGDVGVT